ncbi:MAG: helix-turn-helix domain-containing protein [Bacteroidales bacterium]|jgi:hypothetical protein|nr:helix-turn-helix domain-containing protein [Bacteroidales bacterium]
MTPNEKDDKKIPIYTVDDVLKILGISPSTLWRLKRKAGIKTEKHKRKTRYSEEELNLLVAALLDGVYYDAEEDRALGEIFSLYQD